MEIKKCKGCNADLIFLATKSGKRMPVLASSVNIGDTEFDVKKHRSHFADCQAAQKFRKPREKKEKVDDFNLLDETL